LLLLIYAFLLALPRFGINLPVLGKLAVPIILVNAATLAEVFRSGITAVDRDQHEAAAAIGLRTGGAMRLVILPQAVRLMIPALVTQLVALLKDSTLGYVVSYPELMKQAGNLTVYTHLLVQTHLVVALVYVVVNLALSRLARQLERRLGRRVRRAAASGGEAAGTGGTAAVMA
jgi:glutamate transport system permease protein